MNESFKKIFLKSKNIMNWIEGPGIFGLSNVINLVVGTLFFVISMIIIFNFEGYIIIFGMGIFLIVTFSVILLLCLKYFWLKPPKFIRQGAEEPSQLFDKFSHTSFLYGIFVFPCTVTMFILVIINGFTTIIMQVPKFILFNWSSHLFFLTTSIFTVFYFMYHVSIKEVSTKIVKERIRLYLAIITTISGGLFFGFALNEISVALLTHLGIGIAWLSYFVDKVEDEKN